MEIIFPSLNLLFSSIILMLLFSGVIFRLLTFEGGFRGVITFFFGSIILGCYFTFFHFVHLLIALLHTKYDNVLHIIEKCLKFFIFFAR